MLTEQVDLIEHEQELILVLEQLRDVLIVNDRIPILLRIKHPDHRVDFGEEPLDDLMVLQHHAVVVREIDDGQLGQ